MSLSFVLVKKLIRLTEKDEMCCEWRKPGETAIRKL